MSYNKIYQENRKVWGEEPSPLLAMVLDKMPKGIAFLDLGCGQGRDSLFMAKNGFNVVAVDSSEVAVEQMQTKIEQKN